MRTQIIFRVLVGLAVAALFVMAGRSRGPASATASQPVAAAGETVHR